MLVVLLSIVAIVIVYIWRVSPFRARREMEDFKSRSVEEVEAFKKQSAAEFSLLVKSIEEIKQSQVKSPSGHIVTTDISGTKIKAIWAEFDRIRVRLDAVEKTCPKHQEMLNEALTKMQVINDTLPKALDSINNLGEKVWDIAMKERQGKY